MNSESIIIHIINIYILFLNQQSETGQPTNQLYDAMVRVRDCVLRNWKDMRKAFRVADHSNCGRVDSSEFRRVLRQFSINLSEDEFYHLQSYYDKHIEGFINYNDFIRAYLKYS